MTTYATTATWACCRLLAAFFEGPVPWRAQRDALGSLLEPVVPQVAALLAAGDDRAFDREYEVLFYGVDASVSIPLWASACKQQGTVLLDQTTLELVRACHRWGYAPEPVDGNPPDYIGSQWAFLEYLWACMVHSEAGGDTVRAKALRRAADRFVQDFLIDTAVAVAEGIREHGSHPQILAAGEAMVWFLRRDLAPFFTLDGPLPDQVARGFPTWEVAAKGPAAPIPDEEERVVITSGINNCGGRCVIKARVREGCVLAIDTDQSGRDPQLQACVRGRAYRRTFFQAGRLRYPMKRVGKRGEGKFTRISWDEAVELIADNWKRIYDQHGPESRFSLNSTGNEAVLRGDHMAKRLLNLTGGFLDQYNNYSAACVEEISPYIYGDKLGGHSMEDVLNTRLLILWGNNPAETFFGSERNATLTKLRDKGVRIVVVDPRRSDTAVSYADQWIGIRPGTDSAMADAIAYVIRTEELWDKEFLDKYCVGFDEDHMPPGVPAGLSYESYLLGRSDGVPKTPAWAEAICGVPGETIARLAREYAGAKPACLLPGYGVQRTGSGEQSVRSLALLCAMTGNVGIPGGSSGGACKIMAHEGVSFPQGENPCRAEISHFLWDRAIENGPAMTPEADGLRGVERLSTGIKMMFSIASNTLINQHSNSNDTARILSDESGCRFILCSDIFMTASARFADVLLPAASAFETDNFSESWSQGDYLLCINKVVEPLFQCRFEWDWLREVADRLGVYDTFVEGKPELSQWRAHLYEELRRREPELPPLEDFVAAGGYSYKNNKPYIAYQRQREDPEGHPFATTSGKIEIFSKRIWEMNDPQHRPAIPRYVPFPEGPEDPLTEKYPLQLVGWHTKRRAHSVHDNNSWLEEVEPHRLWMHPRDAADRGIGDGALVEVFNDRGIVRIPVLATDRVARGVVAMAQGAWYTPDEDGVDVRGNINTLTSTHAPTPFAKGNPQHTSLVQVRRAGGEGN